MVSHNASFLFLNFTALTNETDANVQSWGIKDLIIAVNTCNSFCATCFGPLDSDCLSCTTGYYLQGNVCLQSCEAGYLTVA